MSIGSALLQSLAPLVAPWILLAGACGLADPHPLMVLSDGGTIALNGEMEVRLSGVLDPLTATARSVSVRDEAGRRLVHHLRVQGDVLVVQLVVDERLLADPPRSVVIHLAGLPSLHALADREGRRLPRAQRRAWDVRGRLEGGRAALDLVSIQGRPVGGEIVRMDDELELVFAGVLDPSSVRPEAVPLLPVEDALHLLPVYPAVRWTVRGQVSTLTIARPEGPGPWELHTRRLGLAGLEGSSVEPLVVLRLARGPFPPP